MSMEKPTLTQLQNRRAAWVAALRSGKYRQTKGALARVDQDGREYCCLGVACEVAIEMGFKLPVNVPADGKIEYGEELKTGALPEELLEFFGMPEHAGNNGNFYDEALLPYPLDEFGCLAELNDNGATFEQIADFIESNPPGLFIDDAARKSDEAKGAAALAAGKAGGKG